MNDKGISFVETLLTVVIIMLLTSTLIPLSSRMNESLLVSKRDLHASQVAYNGAKQIVDKGIASGSEVIEMTTYHWNYDGQKLCVTYQMFKEVEMKCLSQEGVL